MRWIEEMDAAKKQARVLEKEQQHIPPPSKVHDVLNKFINEEGVFQIPNCFTLKDVPAIDELLGKEIFTKEQHKTIEVWLNQYVPEDRMFSPFIEGEALDCIHALRIKNVQGYISAVQWLSHLQSQLLNKDTIQFTTIPSFRYWKMNWIASDKITADLCLRDKMKSGNNLFDVFTNSEVYNTQDSFLKMKSSIGARYRSMLLLQYQTCCRGDEVRSISYADLFLCKQFGVQLYILKAHGKCNKNGGASYLAAAPHHNPFMCCTAAIGLHLLMQHHHDKLPWPTFLAGRSWYHTNIFTAKNEVMHWRQREYNFQFVLNSLQLIYFFQPKFFVNHEDYKAFSEQQRKLNLFTSHPTHVYRSSGATHLASRG